MGGNVARMGEMRGTYKIFVGNPEGEIPLGRPRRRCEDNIELIHPSQPYEANTKHSCNTSKRVKIPHRLFVKKAVTLHFTAVKWCIELF
jgi:hypothetical protein